MALFLFALLALIHQIDAAFNTTEDMMTNSSSEEYETTQVYTSTAVESCVTDTKISATDLDCVLEYSDFIFYKGGNTYMTLCAIQRPGVAKDENADDYDTKDMDVVVTLKMPADKWVGVGFRKEKAVKMEGYAVVVDPCSRDLTEIYLTGIPQDPNAGVAPGDLLASTITVRSDVIEDNYRTIQYQRKMTIEPDDVSADSAGDNLNSVVNKYFDFGEYTDCNATIYTIYAEGPEDDVLFGSYRYHGTANKKSGKVFVESEDSEDCKGDTDSVNGLMAYIALLIGSIAVLVF